jgi:hypothetical protein
MQPQVQMQGPDDEGGMARADLYRAAKHSMKLFQMIQNNQQLEGWVQAKITKAADYLDSIYHYMEYQVKFGQGAVASSVDDITGDMETAARAAEEADDEKMEMEESMNYEQKLQALLESAVKKAKKDYDGDGKVETNKDEVWGSRAKAAAKAGKPFKEGFSADAKVGDTFKTAKGVATKTATGVTHTRTKYDYDPGSDDKEMSKVKRDARSKKVKEEKFDPLKHVKNPTAGEKKAAKDVKRGSYADRAAMLKSAEKDGRLKEADGKCNHSAKGEKCPVHGLKECGTMMAYEAAKPSAGMSKGAKSALVKKAKAGKDIGKKGKGFEKLADKAAEKYGSKEKGQKVAAAAMWKNIKRENAEGEVDQEGQMAKVQLKKIAEYAMKIYSSLQDDTQLDAWVQDHIAKAAELMDQVGHFMDDQNDTTLIQPVAEKKLSNAEKTKKEDIIMALKKKKAEKEKLGPKDYAIATAQAKKLAE